MELFHAIDVEAAHEVYEKKNIRQFVMAEWDKLVELCSKDLPVFVLEKQNEGANGSCFCCHNLSSMEIILLPCCKARVHRHCDLDALTTNAHVFTAGTICHLKIFLIVLQFEWHYLEMQVTLHVHSKKTQPQNQ
jgi:hypothetical protein